MSIEPSSANWSAVPTNEVVSSRRDQPAPPRRPSLWLPALSLWWRELVRFYRQRSRVAGVLGSPLIFWLVIGSGIGDSFRPPGVASGGYLEYFFPGTVVLIILFTSIFCMMSVIEDRKEGFLLSVLVSPSSRGSLVLGKVLGGATLALLQGMIFLLLGPLVGIELSLFKLLASAGILFVIAFGLTSLGFLIAWRLDSTHGFHALINLFLVPMWLVSGALFPLAGASSWIGWLMRLNPLTYGMTAFRQVLAPATTLSSSLTADFGLSLAVLLLASGVTFGAAMLVASRSN